MSGRNRRGTARFGVDSALPVLRSAQDRAHDSRGAAPAGDYTTDPGLRNGPSAISLRAEASIGPVARVGTAFDGRDFEIDCAPRSPALAFPDQTPLMARTTDPQIEHLLRRAGFGARADELDAYSGMSATDAVDTLINYDRADDDVDANIGRAGFAGTT